jgi:uncharacterized protein with FMN-binding domain
VRSTALRHVAPSALAAGLAITGCGEDHKKVQRSDKPVTVTTPATTTAAAATKPRAKPSRRPDGTVTGSNVPTKFGDVQVSVTFKAGRIADVQYLKLPFDRQRSQYISQTAAPILRSEVLSAQSAQINIVSGATYTSEGWANSVASALAKVP